MDRVIEILKEAIRNKERKSKGLIIEKVEQAIREYDNNVKRDSQIL
jgi:hypothetical protein